MHKLILFAAVVSAPAFAACPQVNGTFNCTSGATSAQLTFTTSVQNGATVYTLNGVDFITDGQPHPTPGTFMPNGKYTATCDASGKVLVHAEGPYQWGTASGYLRLDDTVALTGANVNFDNHMDFLPYSGPEQTQDTPMVCTP